MERFIEQQNSVHFDLIIIGGGITGATLAYEASSRGLKVALFEKADFSGATSAATTKLIHGGLRYLKNFEFGLVRESLRERRILENIAPNFIYPLPFMVPSYKSLKNNRWILFMGMILYGLLSYDKGFTWDRSKKLKGFKSVSAKKTLKKEPCVKQKKLAGSTIYYDCQCIFPERLTLAFIKSAIKYGARVSNYAKVESLITENKLVKGVIVTDFMNNKQKKYTSGLTVNCAGPWADVLLNKACSNGIKHHIKRSEGIHIITKKICQNHAVTVITKDDKHIMVIPWRNHSLIGTTDKDYKGNPDDYKVSKKSILELIETVNTNYGNIELKYNDILFAYGGLRPLAECQDKDSYESSRKYEIFDNANEGLDGLLTVEGGKYTTSRQLADNVMKIIERKLERNRSKSVSDNQFLVSCEIENMNNFLDNIKAKYTDFKQNTIDYLGKNYGTECYNIFDIARENNEYKEVVNSDGEILAEVVYAVRNEMAISLSDILLRRTGIGTLGHPGKEIIEKVAKLTKTLLNWDDDRYDFELKQAEKKFELPES